MSSFPFLSLDRIDWERPWFEAVRALAAPLAGASDLRFALSQAAAIQRLTTLQDRPLNFVAQSALPPGMAYESFIWQTGCVPTRDNLHDFFNALIWLAFPRIKARLNALQAREIERLRDADLGGRRGSLRDALTVFDENAAFLIVRRSPNGAACRDALCAHRWTDVFLDRRESFKIDYDVQLFGHALLEKLVDPYKAITAHARLVEADDAYFDMDPARRRQWLDAVLDERLRDLPLGAIPKTPLPVAGLPGWWPDQNRAFYEDTQVFRPKRSVEPPHRT